MKLTRRLTTRMHAVIIVVSTIVFCVLAALGEVLATPFILDQYGLEYSTMWNTILPSLTFSPTSFNLLSNTNFSDNSDNSDNDDVVREVSGDILYEIVSDSMTVSSSSASVKTPTSTTSSSSVSTTNSLSSSSTISTLNSSDSLLSKEISPRDTVLTQLANKVAQEKFIKPLAGNQSPNSLFLWGGTDITKKRGTQAGAKYKSTTPGYKDTTGYAFKALLDSSTGKFLLRQTSNGTEYGVSQFLTLDDYLTRRREYLATKRRDSLTYKYELKKPIGSDELSRILNQSTGFSIPLPPNPLTTIFGKPEIGINVNGEINVRAGWRWDSQTLGAVSAFGQTQSGPVFSQNIQMNVTGRIGDKLRLGVDWNTMRPFEFDNTFRIGFDGDQDDIIKRVEAGNVQLQTPSQFIGGSQALFGARLDMQFGPVMLKTIASQRRGQRRTVSIRGGSLRQPFSLRAYDYAENHFFLDTNHRPIYREFFRNTTGVLPNGATFWRVKEIEVYESTNDLRDVQAIEGIAYDTLSPILYKSSYPQTLKRGQILAGETERGRFVRLDVSRYAFDANLGTLAITSLRRDRTYAVAFRIEGTTASTDDDQKVGTLSNTVNTKDTLILRLVYRPNMQPGFRTIWKRQMRNIYQIGAQNVQATGTNIGLWYFRANNDSTDVLEGTSQKLVTVMGVDRVNNNSGSTPPDGIFDIQSTALFDASKGEIIFPSLEPFREGLRDYFRLQGNQALAERFVYSAVYDTVRDVARLQTEKDRFIISGEVTGQAAGRIQIPNAFNLPQGSVRVTLDGQQLQEGSDFRVEYAFGTVILQNPRALLPNANVNIEYEQNDVFNVATRTLVGARADLDMKTLLRSRTVKANLGMTWMMFNQALIQDRVRLGEEPVSNAMFGVDGQFQWDAKPITRLLDALPIYDTKEPSLLTLRGEWALMMPDPNKKKSDIPSDNGQSVVYVDDFEGAPRNIPLGLTPSQWTYSSPPNSANEDETKIDDTTRAKYRGELTWFRYFLARTPLKEVYPNRSVVQGFANVNEMYVNFDPTIRGIYNRNSEYYDKFTPGFENSLPYGERVPQVKPLLWAGMTRLLSSFNTNFDVDNIDFIEIMMKVEIAEPGSKMYIDLGQISEDIIPDQKLSTEDGITTASPIANNIIDAGEDLGLDALSDDEERNGPSAAGSYLPRSQEGYPAPLNKEADPARDNYSFDFTKAPADQVETDFARSNRFENNASQSQIGQFPDTEILNKNNGQTLMLDNSYFRYEVSLRADPTQNSQIVGGNPASGWYLWRIPIRGKRQTVGKPLFSNIQYARVWFGGGAVKLRIADWRLSGGQWQRMNATLPDGSTDTTLNIAFVNREENAGAPDFYTMPPGVSPPRQLNNPDPNQDILLNEQSMAVTVRDLNYNDERAAIRYFPRPLDLFYYKRFKYFIHGKDDMPDTIAAGQLPRAYAFVRIGIDSLNYYEYRRPLLRGWRDIDLSMQELTAIKSIRDTSNGKLLERAGPFRVSNDPLGQYFIRGTPILTRVGFIAYGISVPPDQFPNRLSTTMWVNELRLVETESQADWAATAGSTLKLADLGNIAMTFNRTNAYFHRLEERFNQSRTQNTNWNVQGNFQLEKFVPKDFAGTAIPLSMSHSEQISDPIFAAQSDVKIDEAVRAARQNALDRGLSIDQANAVADATRTRSQTLIVQDQFALQGIKIGLPIKDWYIRDTFNRLTFGYSYAQQFERSPVVSERFRWRWDFTANYSITLPSDRFFEPFKWLKDVPILGVYSGAKWYYTPSNFASSLQMTRERVTEQSRFLEEPSPVFRNFMATQQGQFSWKFAENGLLNPTLDYSVNTRTTLVPYELDENNRQRSGGDLFGDMFFKNGRFFNGGDPVQHAQNVTITFRPKLPNLVGLDKFVDVTGNFNTQYTWQNQLQPDPSIRDLAKAAGFNNTLRFGLGVRWRAISDAMFGTKSGLAGPGNKPKDTTTAGVTGAILDVLRTIFFDYDNITINFNQTNVAKNMGVLGGTGLSNVWGRTATFRGDEDMFGPSTAYQLGLVNDPHGSFRLRPSSSFPFFGFETTTGLRPINGTMQDNFAQQTSMDMRTQRPLWQGATLQLNWRSQFSFNRNQTVVTDAEGNPSFQNVILSESYDRTAIALPNWLIFSPFNNSVTRVIELYNERRPQIESSIADTVTRNQKLAEVLAESFRDGLETFSFFPTFMRQIMPRLNWEFRWEGLEKWGLWDGVLRRVSLEHRYQSKYQTTQRVTDIGRVIEGQLMEFGFQPLIKVNVQFDEAKMNGNLTGNIAYNTRTGYRLASSNRSTISRDVSNEFTATVSYNRRGWKIPLFGLDLQNDLELSLQSTYRRNLRATFDVTDFKGEDGVKLDGTTEIIFEPRARYTMSRFLTASFFIRYQANLTEGAATPGTSTTQVGLDLRIAVSGGR